MEHAHDAARKNAVDMRHKLHIIGIIMPDIALAVGEALPPCEMLFEVGKAARHRMSARIDDLRIGQDQVNEPDMQPVVGQLVDEEGLIRFALDAGALKERLAHPLQILR